MIYKTGGKDFSPLPSLKHCSWKVLAKENQSELVIAAQMHRSPQLSTETSYCQQSHYGRIFKISSYDQDDGGGESEIN